MHRQSLGSPVSKLHNQGGQREDGRTAQESRRRESVSLSSSAVIDCDDHERELKSDKPLRPPSPSLSKTEKLVHAIPVLTLICFLILYLASYTPSQTDLASISGFRRFQKELEKIKSDEISDGAEFLELRRGDALAIRSLRNMRKIEKNVLRARSSRKIADF